jgi:hypothetical protein
MKNLAVTIRTFFQQLAVLLSVLVMVTAVQANPINGVVETNTGSASITTTPGEVVVQQATPQVVINWDSFNIKPNEVTRFIQPDQNSVALNRINPNQGVSEIYGQLSANGKIILVNQAGIFFGPGARVDVSGLIASTSDIVTKNFLAGKYIFDIPSGFSGSVINAGTITAANYGLVALIGTGVRNDGTINARLGSVILGSGNKFTLDFSGDRLINFSVDEEAASAGQDRQKQLLTDGVSNTGTIIADGGTIKMTARAAQGILDNSVNLQGIVRANSIATHNGDIILSGGDGRVTVSGKVRANGRSADQRGGNITISAAKINLTSTAQLSASGQAGGGTILIGGDVHGASIAPNLINATFTTIASGATISANALTNGNGGKIIVWSTGDTQFHGAIAAHGGALGGDGGFVETSGGYLNIAGAKINLSSPFGATGNWLLDPSNVVISSAATAADSYLSNTYTPTAGASVINATELGGYLDGGANITINTTYAGAGSVATGSITVASPVTWSSVITLTLLANGGLNDTITINSNGASPMINATGGGNLVLTAGTTNGTITINGGITLVPTTTTNGALTLSASNNLTSITTGANGTVSVGNFILAKGIWSQTGSSNPSFSVANNFQLAAGGTFNSMFNAKFIRNSGNLVIAGVNYTGIYDIYGLQGVTTGPISSFNFALTNNIDATVTRNWTSGFVPIANYNAYTNSNFDGQNFTINNLYINAPTKNYGGLFGISQNSNFKNVTLNNVNITGNTYVGGLVGNAQSGSIQNVSVSGSVTGVGSYVGGILGTALYTTLQTLSNSSTVVGGSYSGGISGFLSNSASAQNLLNTGTILPYENTQYVGGLFGSSQSSTFLGLKNTGQIFAINSSYLGGNFGYSIYATITNAQNLSDITSNNNYVGGLVGQLVNSTLNDSFNSGNITGLNNNYYIGGLMGSNETTTINNSYNTGAISGNNSIGGLIGTNNYGTINNSYNMGSVNASASLAGGLSGYSNYGFINKSFNTANINSTGTYAGGLVGRTNNTTINNSYNTGSVSGSTAGGLVGYVDALTITASYSTGLVTGTTSGGVFGTLNYPTLTGVVWDVITSGKTNGSGSFGSGTAPTSLYGGCFGVCSPVTLTNATNAGTNVTPVNLSLLSTYLTAGWTSAAGSAAGITSTASTSAVAPNFNWFIFNGMTRPLLLTEYNTTISTPHQLQLAATTLGANYTLANNIELKNITPTDVWNSQFNGTVTGNGFIPIGDVTNAFTGNFNGQNYVINSLYINSSASSVGLFGQATLGTIQNIGVTNVNVTGNNMTGALVGNNASTILNSYTTGRVNGADGVGGFIGNNTGVLSNIFSLGSVYSTTNGGGLLGILAGGSLTNSYSLSSVNGSTNVGGLIGQISGGAATNTYSAGAVSGTTNVGGLIGNLSGGSIASSFWDTATSNQAAGIGLTGAGSATNITGGCLAGGLCANGGTANLSAAATFSSAPYNWDVATTWGNVEGVTYPFLQNFPRRFLSGTTLSPGQSVALVANGYLIQTIISDATTGQFTFNQNYGVIPNSGALLFYLTGATKANTHLLAPVAGANLANITFNANSLTLGFNNISATANSTLFAAIAGLTAPSTDILYTATQAAGVSNIVVASGVNLLSNINNAFTVNGALSNNGGSGSFTFNGDTVVKNTTITSTGNQVYNGALTLLGVINFNAGSANIDLNGLVNGYFGNLTLTSSGSKSLNNNIGSSMRLRGLTLTGGGNSIINAATINATTQVYNDAVLLAIAATTLTGQTQTFSSTINGAGTLNVNGTGVKTFSGNIGSITPLTSLAISGNGSTIFNGINITTTGNQTYSDPIKLVTNSLTNTWRTTGAGNIVLGGAVDWFDGGTLALNSANNIIFNAAINGGVNNTLLLTAANTAQSITTGVNGAITVDNFNLLQGQWYQVGASLPAFNIGKNFQINSGVPSEGVQFIRAASVSGTAPNLTYGLFDIYGVQGITSNSATRAYNYLLTNIIDALTTLTWNNGAGFVPIGTGSSFAGNFNGQNFSINNLFINRPTSTGVALFATTLANSGTFQNLNLTNVNVTGLSAVAGLLGSGGGNFSNITISGNITSGNGLNTAGLIGAVNVSGATTISNVANLATVTSAGNNVGGIVGSFGGSSTNNVLQNSYNAGAINGVNNIGGLVGVIGDGAPAITLLTNSYNSGLIKNGASSSSTGSLVGVINNGSSVQNSLWDAGSSGQLNSYGTNAGSVQNLLGGCFGNVSCVGAVLTNIVGTTVTPNSLPLDLTQLSSYTQAGWSTTAGAAGSITSTPSVTATAPNYTWFIFPGQTRPLLMSELFSTNLSTPSVITTPHQLQLMGVALGGNYNLGSNIDFSSVIASDIWGSKFGTLATGTGFVPVGNSTAAFSGNFNGQNSLTGQIFAINNLYINTPAATNVGLFGQASLTTNSIQKVNLTNANITGSANVGGLVGYLNNGTVTNVSSLGNIIGSSNVGGLVGYADASSTISLSYSGAAVAGLNNSSNIGGLVGLLNGAILNSYSYGYVTGGTGSTNLGGLVGSMQSAGVASIGYSYSTGQVNSGVSGATIGGLVGLNLSTLAGNIIRGYWDINTSGQTVGFGSGSTAPTGSNTLSGLSAAGTNAFVQNSYTGLDFTNVWFTPNYGTLTNVSTRPILRAELAVVNGTGIITNGHQLQLVAANLGANYLLANDINLASTANSVSDIWGYPVAGFGASIRGFNPIGYSSGLFAGNFNGQNYTISNLNINNYTNATLYTGLFAQASSASTIKNLNLTNYTVTGSGNYLGALVGSGAGTIDNVYTAGSLTANTAIQSNGQLAGLIGLMSGGVLRNSHATTILVNQGSGNNVVAIMGGLVGKATGGNINNIYSDGVINGIGGAFGLGTGGLVGYLGAGVNLTN